MRQIRPQPSPGRHLWQIAAARDVAILLFVASGLAVVYWLSEVFLPVFLAFVLAEVFNPAISRAEERWHWPRPLTVALIVTLILAAIVGFFAWLGPLLMDQITHLAANLPDYVRTLAAGSAANATNLIEKAEAMLRDLEPQQLFNQIFSTTGRAVGIAAAIFSTTTHMVISLLLVLLYFFLFAWRFNAGLAKLAAYVPQSRKPQVFTIAAKMDAAVTDFFRGRLLIAAIVGVLLSAGWFITGVPYWFLLGMLTGILNIVPYLALITWPVAVLLKYADALGSGAAQSWLDIVLWPSAVFGVVQFFEGWILTPWIQSGQTEMSAATVLLVVFVGGAVAGVWGMLFAIPVAACIKILLEELALPPLKRWAATH